MGGSWDALKWAKDSRVGNHADKLVLLVMADKANERFELYPSKKELAQDCEMSPRRLGDHQQSLADKGLITVIERTRRNGAQARTTVVLNHPAAPHMNGEPIVLDFQGHWNYPKYPGRLRDSGIQWISGTKLNAVSSGSHGESDPAAQGGVTDRHPRGVTDRHGGGDGLTPPGGDGSSPQNQPTEPPTTNQEPGRPEVASEIGWLDAKKKIPDSPGARYLLHSLKFPDGSTFGAAAVRALHEHVDALLAVGWTEQGITSEITNAGGAQVQNWGGFARTKLEEIPLQAPAAAGAAAAADRAHADVTRMAKQKAPGAREAASLLGLSWHEPDRGDASAQEYLVNVVPAVARQFVESHRQELVAVLARGARSSTAA